MDTRYQDYCLADRFFYDVPGRAPSLGIPFLAERQLPGGWQTEQRAEWTLLGPRGVCLPPQGWKVHLSACLDNAATILGIAWDYCVAHSIAFKFLTTRADLLVRNAKYANRAGSGKFITLYPPNDAEFEEMVDRLAAVLAGRHGPYIITWECASASRHAAALRPDCDPGEDLVTFAWSTLSASRPQLNYRTGSRG
jgi:hypothetical protein